jgi:hypothetical protein
MAQTSPFQSKRARQILNAAVREFKADLPDLVDARDIIEHFDKYAVGQGDLQIKDRKGDPSLTDAQLAKRYEARLEGLFGEPIIRVGERAIEVTKIMGAHRTRPNTPTALRDLAGREPFAVVGSAGGGLDSAAPE